MKQVTLLRHAKAAQGTPGQEDRDRPLNSRGLADAAAVGRDTAQDIPDIILCSAALRTRETLRSILDSWPRRPQIEFAQDLYLASADHLLERLSELPETIRSAWLIGHNPDLHELAICFARGGGSADERAKLARFPTSARATFAFEIDDWHKIGHAHGRLIALRIPE